MKKKARICNKLKCLFNKLYILTSLNSYFDLNLSHFEYYVLILGYKKVVF